MTIADGNVNASGCRPLGGVAGVSISSLLVIIPIAVSIAVPIAVRCKGIRRVGI